MSQKVLVLDLTHGGEVLAYEYAERGDQVTIVDIYHTGKPELKSELIAAGIRVAEAAPAETFDLGIVPIHCPDHFIGEAKMARRITAHQATGELAKFPYPIVEFTGTRGKTSACHVLAHMLAQEGQKVALLTSKGLSIVEECTRAILKDKVSIAPPSVLSVAKMDLQVDIGVFEVSIGGTGLADVSVVTGLDDYPIAAGTRKAFYGKVQMIESAKSAAVYPQAEAGLWEKHVPQGTDVITFGPGGDVSATLPKQLKLGKAVPLNVEIYGDAFKTKLPGTFLVPSYKTAFNSAIAAAVALGMDMDAAIGSLSSFGGVPGRGEVSKEKGWYLISERNPGVSAGSIEWNVSVLERYYGQEDIGVAVDPVNQKVCEKLVLDDVREALSKHPAVKGQYVINMPGFEPSGFRRIDSFVDVRGRHKVLMQCIKEGYL